MTDKLYLKMLELLMFEAESRRDQARVEDNDLTADMWSAVSGHLDNARQRMRK